MAAPTVTSTVTLRSGEKKDFCQHIQCTNSRITHEKLRESLQIMQKEVNDFLTVQVDLEKGAEKQSNSRSACDSLDEEDEGDEDEDEPNCPKKKGQGDADEEQRSQGPPEKKHKK